MLHASDERRPAPSIDPGKVIACIDLDLWFVEAGSEVRLCFVHDLDLARRCCAENAPHKDQLMPLRVVERLDLLGKCISAGDCM